MAITLNDNINLASNKPLDKRFGPYLSINDALSDIPSFQRYQGLVVGIIDGNSVVDYWFRDGINDSDLITKISNDLGNIDYGSLINTPTIPSDVSDLTDLQGLLVHTSLEGYATESFVNNAVSGLTIPQDVTDLTDTENLLGNFSFTIQSDDSGSFTVSNRTQLRLSGNFSVKVEEDSTEGLVISGPDLKNLNTDLIPSLNEVYDLGSPTHRWKDLYLSGTSISIGDVTISTGTNGNSLVFEGANEITIGSSAIKDDGGKIDLPAGSMLNGSPLLTRVELLESAFQLNISGEDSSTTSLVSGSTLNIIGAGGTNTNVDTNGNLIINSIQSLNELSDVEIDPNSLAIGKVLKYNGQSWVAALETGNTGDGSGSGDAATLNGFDGTHYLNYNNLVNKPDPYVLPPATTTALGGVIVGNNVTVNGAGRIDVPTGAGINTVTDIPDVIDVDGLDDGDTLVYNAALNRWEINTVDLTDANLDGGFY